MLVDRYLIREVSTPLLAITLLLALLFVGYAAADHLADATQAGMPLEAVLQLILYDTLVALEVLLPIGLYLAVVIGMGRLYSDNEIVALASAGVGEWRILKPVTLLALLVAMVVGLLSTYGRPWAYGHSYAIKLRAEERFSLDKVKAGQFYFLDSGQTVIFSEAVDLQRHHLKQVFFHHKQGASSRVIRAETAFQAPTRPGRKRALIFRNGYSYEVDRIGKADSVLKFKKLTLFFGRPTNTPGYKRKAATTTHLMNATGSANLAELQWRLSRPVATLLLGTLGVPLSRSAPRSGRYGRALTAILLYAVYFNLSGLARSWVQDGVVGAVPGIWWPEALLGLLFLGLMAAPVVANKLRRKRN